MRQQNPSTAQGFRVADERAGVYRTTSEDPILAVSPQALA